MGSLAMAIPLQGHGAHQVNPRIAAASGTLQARLHNFVKYALLQQLVPPGSTVCDLYCGRGVDTEKWARAQIGRYVGVDFTASTLEEAQEQWNNLNRPYDAEFCEADPSMANLEMELRYMGLPMDVVTCMGHLQHCFLKEEMVKSLLQNVVSILRPGGYFFGITADSSTIWSKFQKAVEHRGGAVRALPRVHSEHYVISFEDDRFTPFGTKYTLQFTDGVSFESQQLIHFPSFIRLAEQVGLEYVELQNLQEFFDDYRLQFPDILRTTCANLVDAKGRLPQFAHDVLSLYTTFIFKKADYLDPNYMPSPFPSPLDEEQVEMCAEDDAGDGKKVPFQDHASPPVELDMAPKKLPMAFPLQAENKEAPVHVPEEDPKACPTIVQAEGSLHLSLLDDSCKERARELNIKCDSKQSAEDKDEVKLDVKTPGETAKTSREIQDNQAPDKRLELEDVQTSDKKLRSEDVKLIQPPGFICKGDHPDEDHNDRDKEYKGPLESMGEQIHCDSPPESGGTHTVIEPGTPLGDSKRQLGVADEANVLQLHFANRDVSEREASMLEDVVMEEVREVKKEQSISEKQAVEEILAKPLNAHAPLSRKRTRDKTPPTDDSTKETSLAELDVREQTVSDKQPEEMKEAPKHMKEVPKHDSELLAPTDVRKAASPAHVLDTVGDLAAPVFDMNGDRSSIRQSLGRLHLALREESIHKRLHVGPLRYRAGRPHHLHPLVFSEERQEHPLGPRHASHSPLNPKASRDRVAEHRSEHLSPNQRGESHRGRPRSAHHSSPFVPFSHFVPQTEFPIFHSPNTPGILGPAPPAPVLLIEPFCPLWPIPPPLERRVFPKSRTPRKSGADREVTGGGRARRESPKRHHKESPPPGTES